jgi:hypothetical protein
VVGSLEVDNLWNKKALTGISLKIFTILV